ncbi:MAG: isoprenylcysteine carboxylmethyltransferase family protein [Chloroflexota bacterium]
MEAGQKTISPRVIIIMLFFIVVVPALPLLISRHWNWWEAWVYFLLCIVSFAISRLLAARNNPGIIKERAQFMQHDNTQSWDNLLAPFTGFGGGVIPLIAGLDALYGWSQAYSLNLKIMALIIILAGYVLSSYALITNHFFSGTVRLQTERGHHVISGGPYRWVRHPGYIGAILTYMVTPIFLDSFWVFLPAVFVTLILVIRTALEDRFLQKELQGYREYALQVRYRLFPGIW